MPQSDNGDIAVHATDVPHIPAAITNAVSEATINEALQHLQTGS
jgi:hypothetical protein